MANPRADVDFTGIGEVEVTFKRKTSSTGAIDYLPSITNPYPSSTSTQIGQSVSMDSNKTVKVGADGDIVKGKLINSEQDGMCTVQTRGYMQFSHTNAADKPVLGRGVVCDGAGGVSIAAASSEWKERGEVVYVDTTVCIVEI